MGVAAIICVSSIFNGFRDMYQTSMIAYDPHVRIHSADSARLQEYHDILSTVRSLPHVVAAEPVLEGRCIISVRNTFRIVQMHGVAVSSFQKVSGIARSMVAGDFREASANDLPRIVIGAECANAAELAVEDTITLLSPHFIEQALQSFMAPQGQRCVVGGIFYTNSKEYNEGYAYCDTGLAQRLFSAPTGSCTAIDCRLDDVENADDIAHTLQSTFGTSYSIDTWYDLHKDLYSVMRFERLASFVVLSVIVLVSVFNIFAMLSMTVVRKRRDIAILSAMGASTGVIERIFRTEGLAIGLVGSLSGAALGLGLCFLQIQFHLLRFDQHTFIVNAVPLKIAWIDCLSIVAVSIIFSWIATIIPARRAARTFIAEALRSE